MFCVLFCFISVFSKNLNLDLALIKRHIGELSQLQVRFKGLPRQALLKINNFAYRMGLPSHIAAGTLLVFEKQQKGMGLTQMLLSVLKEELI